MISILISGGQTGADRAALDLAIRYEFPHGGWCPKGRLAEDGQIGSQYRLVETPTRNYLQRTEWNVRDTDGTLILTLAAALTGGSKRTAQFAQKHGKPWLHVSKAGLYAPAVEIQGFVHKHGIKRLNVAGSRASKEPGIYTWASQVLEDAFFWSERHPTLIGGPGEG